MDCLSIVGFFSLLGLALVLSGPNPEVVTIFSCLEPVNDNLPCLGYLENGVVHW